MNTFHDIREAQKKCKISEILTNKQKNLCGIFSRMQKKVYLFFYIFRIRYILFKGIEGQRIPFDENSIICEITSDLKNGIISTFVEIKENTQKFFDYNLKNCVSWKRSQASNQNRKIYAFNLSFLKGNKKSFIRIFSANTHKV